MQEKRAADEQVMRNFRRRGRILNGAGVVRTTYAQLLPTNKLCEAPRRCGRTRDGAGANARSLCADAVGERAGYYEHPRPVPMREAARARAIPYDLPFERSRSVPALAAKFAPVVIAGVRGWERPSSLMVSVVNGWKKMSCNEKWKRRGHATDGSGVYNASATIAASVGRVQTIPMRVKRAIVHVECIARSGILRVHANLQPRLESRHTPRSVKRTGTEGRKGGNEKAKVKVDAELSVKKHMQKAHRKAMGFPLASSRFLTMNMSAPAFRNGGGFWGRTLMNTWCTHW
ncbi:hypothetical protein GGX14DRAFT_398266 [Mycena pura]|uniref:Uncharacterized protein n=1 Tax=Mycena pura TaxID=153505 RepID=A0AAD6YBS2_9AGAR|nr:hypothetical protein GGX14DRAFT_398266 [Mycena pura]